jgi:hypothetical protein
MVVGFSGFGFPKAHGAAFGLLAYQSAWLRVHRPLEFLCALLDEQPMGFYPSDALIHEAQRRDIEIRPPDISRSSVGCTIEDGDGSDEDAAVRVGLGYVLGARADEVAAVVAAREEGGRSRRWPTWRRVRAPDGRRSTSSRGRGRATTWRATGAPRCGRSASQRPGARPTPAPSCRCRSTCPRRRGSRR